MSRFGAQLKALAGTDAGALAALQAVIDSLVALLPKDMATPAELVVPGAPVLTAVRGDTGGCYGFFPFCRHMSRAWSRWPGVIWRQRCRLSR